MMCGLYVLDTLGNVLNSTLNARSNVSSSIEQLRAEYQQIEGLANRFALSISEQLQHLFKENQITLGVPLEFRVKSWQSIVEKLKRKRAELRNMIELQDLIGLRAMLLFKRDVNRATELICETFSLLEREDASGRLKEDQFGYQSIHLVVSMPEAWSKVPSLAAFKSLMAEIQIRTVAQHIWAGASHYLQYKQESGVPLPIRRTIHRVSALLETVDLELERVLDERAAYVREIDTNPSKGSLNVELLKKILEELYPAENKEEPEDYADVYEDVEAFGFKTGEPLRELISDTLNAVLAADEKMAKQIAAGKYPWADAERAKKGVFFTHVGLLRQALKERFGPKWDSYQRTKHKIDEGEGSLVVGPESGDQDY